jgi:single-strand DNA-binding protein
VLWGKTAESLQPYLTKGKQIYVEGRLQTRSWEKDGQKHYTTEIKADRIVLLGGGGRGGDRTDRDMGGYQDPMKEPAAVTDDDIPF